MFAKPYKLKSNNSLKNTEKKNLVQRIHDEFPKADLEKLKELVPNKSVATCMKLMVYSGQMVLVYVVDGVPVMIELESGLVPTVYALWKVPEMIPAITIHSPVLPKVVGGAPLYVPGVVIPTGGVGFPLFASGSLVAARTQDNSTAAVVGRAQMSSADMLLKNIGVCLEIIHVFGDQLCKDSKLARVERPCGTSAAYARAEARAEPAALAEEMGKMSLQPPRDEWPTLGAPPPAEQPPPFAAPARNAPALIPDAMQAGDNVDCEEEEENEDGDEDVPSNMDELLQWSLLTFLKLDAKNVTLPLKTNLLYKNYLIPLCPEDRTLDVKKSSYKKMSKFLEAMQKDGLVEVREIEKGVSALTALNTSHTLVRGLSVPPRVRDHRRAAPAAPDYAPPRVRDLYCLTARVAPLVPHLKKGTGLTAAEVRAILTEHVRTKQLQGSQKQTVTLDTVLAAVTGNKEHESMKWEALTSTVLGRMTAATELRFEDGEVRLIKAKLEPIKMQVATRSGNKKVTLVSNLEAYGFRLPALSHACQLAVGAACGVTRSPGAKNDQLMLQGDQTHFVAKLLIEKYGLPKKFVEGADKALNKKK